MGKINLIFNSSLKKLIVHKRITFFNLVLISVEKHSYELLIIF